MTTLVSAIIPAAGLGTRLSPLTLGVAKELLPLGAYPTLTATLLEAAAAGVHELIVVTAPEKDKPQIGRFFATLAKLSQDPNTPTFGTTAAALELARLRSRFSVRLVEQPQPLGVLDAVARGLALTAAPCAVLFPDLIHLPDQTALTCLSAAYAACGEAVIGLRAPASLGGNTVSVEVPAEYAIPVVQQRARASREPVPIRAVGPSRGTPNELLTTFGQIHTTALGEVIEACCRPQPMAALSDSSFVHALDRLAKRGKLYGVLLPGEVLDIGSLSGYLEASTRFHTRTAQLRGLP